jgi:hypothetical protein
MTALNYWHYIVLGTFLIIYIGGVVASLNQTNKKLVLPMLFSVTLVIGLFAGFSVVVVDKYTKKVKLYKMGDKRLLSIEKIAYFGVVKNEGKHKIGEVTFKIKLVNKGHVTGNVKAGSFFKPSGLLDFFSGKDVLYKPQTIKKEFVVARNLRPGESKSFRVYFDYPPYFRNVSHFASVEGH